MREKKIYRYVCIVIFLEKIGFLYFCILCCIIFPTLLGYTFNYSVSVVNVLSYNVMKIRNGD